MTQRAPLPAPAVTMVTPDGQQVAVAGADLAAARAEGLRFAGDTVPLRVGSGEIQNLPAAEADAVIARRAGFVKASSPEAFAAQEERKKYDSLPYEAGALLAGGARGASFGLSDQVIANAGRHEFLQKSQEYSPWLSVDEIGRAHV